MGPTVMVTMATVSSLAETTPDTTQQLLPMFLIRRAVFIALLGREGVLNEH